MREAKALESNVENPQSVPQSSSWDAPLYDDKHAFVWESAVDLIELLAPHPGERILDLGCGTGHLSAKIASLGAQVIGIDNAESMVAQARANYPMLQFEVVDALSLTYAEEFDAVFSNAALHWISPPGRVAARIWNALKPGGRLVAELGGKGNVQSIVEAITAALNEAGHSANTRQNPWYFPSIAEYSSLLESQGFAVIYAALFDRPTQLEGGENGMRQWIIMFGDSFLVGLPDDAQQAVIHQIEDRLRPMLYRGGAWIADYNRLRLVALKSQELQREGGVVNT